MTRPITNYIQFDDKNIETANGKGKVSDIDYDREIIVRPFTSDNEKAPTHHVFAASPEGHEIQVGGIWKKQARTIQHTTPCP